MKEMEVDKAVNVENLCPVLLTLRVFISLTPITPGEQLPVVLRR